MKVIVPIEFFNLTTKEKIVFKKKTIKTAYITHLINHCLHFKDEEQFSLNSTMMKYLYSKNYPSIVEYLVAHEFIEKVGTHCAGKYSRQYKVIFPFTEFTDPFDLRNTFLEKKWHKHQQKVLNSLSSLETSILPKLRRPLIDNLFKVDIDAVKAYKWMKTDLTDSTKMEYNILKVETIGSNERFFDFDPYGRFHSSFTNLRKELREYLQVNGEYLEELDIQTSQPFFLAQILKNYNYFNVYDRFIDITENHDIYLHLLSQNPQYIRETEKESRDAIKVDIFKTLFDSKRKTTKIPYNKLLDDEFPEVYTFVKHYKKQYGEYLWKTLQRLESNFIFNRIFKALNDLNLFCITIHDSILFEKKDKLIIEGIWNEGLENLKKSL
jgi:hypothetical protein